MKNIFKSLDVKPKPSVRVRIYNIVEKGGQGSGNFGHAGRIGERGGSSSDGGAVKPSKHGLIRNKISQAGKPPIIKGMADYKLAKDYMEKIGVKFVFKDHEEDISVTYKINEVMGATEEFGRRTGHLPDYIRIASQVDFEARYGFDIANIALGLHDINKGMWRDEVWIKDYPNIFDGPSITMRPDHPNQNDRVTMFHEMGHSMDIGMNWNKRAERVFGKFPEGIVKNQLIEGGMSVYGTTSHAEFVAEYITGTMLNKSFSTFVHTKYKQIGGPKLDAK